jgi:Trypsin
MRRGIGVLAMVALSLIASVQPGWAIVYGQPDSSNEFPNVGSMLVELEGEPAQWCTGTYVGETSGGLGIFLTAAHCIVGIEDFGAQVPDDVFVSFSQDLGPGALLIDVVAVDNHPDFGRSGSNPFDIGVLLFDGADTPAGVTAAAIASVGYLDELGNGIRRDRFTTVGYGTIRTSKKKGPAGILANTERRFARQSFRSIQRAWLKLAMNQSTGNGGTCYGDSGGPHIHDGIVVSVTITGDTVCKSLDNTYRLDRPWVHDYLDEFLP